MFLQKAVASGGSELGSKLLPYFPINRGRSEGERVQPFWYFVIT